MYLLGLSYILAAAVTASALGVYPGSGPDDQQILGGAGPPVLAEEQPAPFTLRKQSKELCDAGSEYWTGVVNVTDDKSIFFCKQKPFNAT